MDVSNFDTRHTGQEVKFTAVPDPMVALVATFNDEFKAFDN